MSKAKLDSVIRSQFTSASRIVRELAAFTPSQRERVLALVAEHDFGGEKTEDSRQSIVDYIDDKTSGGSL